MLIAIMAKAGRGFEPHRRETILVYRTSSGTCQLPAVVGPTGFRNPRFLVLKTGVLSAARRWPHRILFSSQTFLPPRCPDKRNFPPPVSPQCPDKILDKRSTLPTMKTESLEFRLGIDEKQAFQRAAEIAGLPLASWIRQHLRKAAREELEQMGEKVPFFQSRREASK